MRIIKKTPMEAITARANNVEKVRKRTLSWLLFGISGSIASRNARRQKKRFAITVLTLTVSITMFALFSTMTETVERSITEHTSLILWGEGESEEGAADIDFEFELGNWDKGINYTEAIEPLTESGLFDHIAFSVEESFQSTESGDTVYIDYVNREEYTQLFGADAPVSYDELISSGGYVYNSACKNYATYADQLQSGSLTLNSRYLTLPEGTDNEHLDNVGRYVDRIRRADMEEKQHTVDIIGQVSIKKKIALVSYDSYLLFGAIETHENIAPEWFGGFFHYTWAQCAYAKNGAVDYQYNAADLKKANNWFRAHSDIIGSVENDENFFDEVDNEVIEEMKIHFSSKF